MEISDQPPVQVVVASDTWMTRERLLALVLVFATGLVAYACYRLVLPFIPSLAWALALAVIAHPLHARIQRWLPHSPSIAAGMSVAIVAIVVVAPAVFVTMHLAREATKVATEAQRQIASGEWRSILRKNEHLTRVEKWIDLQFDMPDEKAKSAEQSEEERSARGADSPADPLEQAAGMLTQPVGRFVQGTAWGGMQLFITFMTLFFFFRDRHEALRVLRSVLPFSRIETDELLPRVAETIHATIFGSVMVALVQGCMGGLMFWLLGLPSPLFWGAIMALLAVVPVLGTFVIWGPAAAYLALNGELTKALMLVGWGAIAIGLIDNFLYPFLVGNRLRFHTLLVFFAILGGLALFGASGVILGPVLLATTDALLEIWKRRMALGEAKVDEVAI